MSNQFLINYSRQVSQLSLPTWDDLPKFDLHMDQVLELVNSYLSIFQVNDEPLITRSMVHNYVKLEMVPKPENKKYNRKHLAYLIAIIMLKNVITIPEIKTGIIYQSRISGIRQAYDLLIREVESAFKNLASIYLESDHNSGEVDSEDRYAMIRHITDSLASQTFVRLYLESLDKA